MIEALRQHTNYDHFDTPAYAVKSLIPFLNKNWRIWECTDTYGRSGITKGLREAGFEVEATNFDFLNTNIGGFDCIVTNPPFNRKTEFIAKCYSYGKPFALLLPLTALEGQKRHWYWKALEDKFGLIVHDKRIDFTGGGVWFNTSWFTYGLFTGVKFVELEDA